MTGGTLLIDGSAARSISSGGGVADGGSIALGSIDGENGAANLTVDSRGTATGGTVSIGSVTDATSGLNRLNIRTDAPTPGQVTLGSIRLVAKAPNTSATLVVDSDGTTILADGIIDLSSSTNADGGSIDFGSSKVAPATASSTLTIKTNNTSTSGGNGGDIQLGGVSNNGANYFDSLSMDTSAANTSKSHGDLDFSGQVNPSLAVDGTSGTGITLIGTILKAFSGVLSFLTNPTGATTSSSSIDVSKADFKTTLGLNFDTSGGGSSTTAGNVLVGAIGISSAERPNAITVDTRGTTATGDLVLDDVAGASTELHVDGDLNLTNTKIKLTDNALLRTYGAGNLTLGGVTTSTAVARNLTLNSESNIAVSAVNLLGGTLNATIDSDNDNVGATFQSTGALSAGVISISGSNTVNDDVTIGSTATTTTGAIQFSKIEDLSLQGDMTAATNITFSNVDGPLVLGSNVDVIANSGPIDFSSIASGIRLDGVNGSTNSIQAQGSTGSLTLAKITATNSNVSLTLGSSTDITADDIDIQSGTLKVTYNDQNTTAVNLASFEAVTAGQFEVSGNSRVNDQVQLNGIATIGTGGVLIDQYNDLEINAALTSAGNITTTGISGSETHLAANVTSNGGDIAMTGGTLIIDGTSVRQIRSGGPTASLANGGTITLGAIDGAVSVAELEIDSRGTAIAGNVTLGPVTAAAGNQGLNRLLIVTDAPTAGQVSLSSIRLVAKLGTPSSLTVSSNGKTILADGTIDLSTNGIGQSGGTVHFGSSVVAPKISSSILTINTSNTNTTSGDDGSDGGSVVLGGIGANTIGTSYFNSVTIDLRAADVLDSSGTLSFGGAVNPSIGVDGVAGTGISLSGKINNPSGGILSLSTNPGGANQDTTSIDVSRANFINTGGLVFDTSGGNHAVRSGNVSLGDIGVTVRPVSLVVDTRGTVTSGHLLLNDGISGSPTEIFIDGNIDFSNAMVDLLDDVALESHLDGNNIRLGTTNATGGARNLRLGSDSGITVAGLHLSGGTLQANVDANGNEIGATFRSNNAINVGSFTVGGSAANDDIASIGGNVTTSGQVTIANLDQLRIFGVVSAGTSFTASSIAGALDFGSNSGINANGSIDLLTSVNAIVLSGVAGSTTSIDARGNTSLVSLAQVSATNGGTRLNVRSDYSVDLQNVNIQTGILDVLIGRSTTLMDSNARLRQVTAGGLTVTGTSLANNLVMLDGLIDIGSNGILIRNLDKLNVNFSVQSDGDFVVNDIGDRIQIADSVSLHSNSGLDLQGNVRQIELLGTNGSRNTFQANGDSSAVRLASMSSLLDVNVEIISSNNANLVGIDTKLGALSIQVDSNNNNFGSQLVSGQIQAGQIAIRGGASQDDIAVLNGLVESRVGDVVIDSFRTVSWNGDVIASNSIQVSNISGRVNIGSGRHVKTFNGDVNLSNNVNEIRFVGGGGTTSSIQAINGSLRAASITETTASSLIELRADRDVLLHSSSLNSNLRIVAGDHNGISGSINSSSTIAAASISLDAATGIGTSSVLSTSTNNIIASNRLAGDLKIANNKSGSVIVTNLIVHEGGNIDFSQSGGGVVRFQGVTSVADTSPVANEGDIRLSNLGGDLIVEGAGVNAGGLGNAVLVTQNTGDIQVEAATRALQGTVSLTSAQRIHGSGAIQGLAVNLNAVTGIGTTGALQTQTTQLHVNSVVNQVDIRNSSAALTNVTQLRTGALGTVRFQQVGGGDVAFSDVSTGMALSGAGSNISLINDNASVFILGSIVAGGGGSIRIDAQNNLTIAAGALLETKGVNATIQGVAGGQFQFTAGAMIRAGSSNGNTEAVVTRIPTLVSVRPVVNPLGVNVDSQGLAAIEIQLGGPNPPLVDRNFSVEIDWGDRQIDRFPNLQIPRLDASGEVYQFMHQYLGNPNPSDPIADIPVTVTVGIDALNRIQFNDSQGPISGLTQVVNQNFVVPAAGLFSLRFDLPQSATIQNRFVFNNSSDFQTNVNVAPAIATTEIVVSSSSSTVEKGRTYVLRVITPINEHGQVESSEDIALTEEDIEDLSSGKLFQRLGDNRYRIYLIREDGNQLLLKDFFLRNHRPVEIDDAPATLDVSPADERVLDAEPSASIQKIDGGLAKDQEGYDEENEINDKSEEKPMTNATLSFSATAHAFRSWRKAARRFRAG
ncbi:MAG: hypothetical protein ABL921_06040 [Pirellula sp.]